MLLLELFVLGLEADLEAEKIGERGLEKLVLFLRLKLHRVLLDHVKDVILALLAFHFLNDFLCRGHCLCKLIYI